MSAHFIESCVRAAGMAPSIHNSQPWQFHAENRSVDVLLDMSRHLPVIDPDGREMMVSAGAALLNLRLAMLAGGHAPYVRLLPGRPFTAARVIVGPPSAPTTTVRSLARAIERRHTTRLPFRSIAVPVPVQDDLVAAAAVEGVRLEFLDPMRRDAAFALTFRAQHRIAGDDGYRRELADWTTWWPGRRDGLAPYALGYLDKGGVVPLRNFRIASPEVPVRRAVFEPRPCIAVLSTRGDGPWHWLRAGQAVQRVLLTATVRGLAAQPMTQALEQPDLRGQLTDVDSGWHAQMILRLGYGRPAPVSPRRHPEAVIV